MAPRKRLTPNTSGDMHRKHFQNQEKIPKGIQEIRTIKIAEAQQWNKSKNNIDTQPQSVIREDGTKERNEATPRDNFEKSVTKFTVEKRTGAKHAEMILNMKETY